MLSKQTRFIIILFLLAIFSCSKPDTFLLRETIKVFPREGIDEMNSHNAFTDLIYFKNKFYCAFRTGNKHVGDNGGILLMSSKDKVKWEKETFFQLEGVDLRDPKFVLDSEQNILSLHIGGSVFENKKWVRFNPVITNSHNGKEWTTLQSLNVQDRWLWRPIKKQDIIYCVGYKSGKSTILYTSKDMVNYIPYVELDFPIEEKTNEATIRFDSLGNAFMIIRSDKKKKGSYLGKSKFPYTEWEWEELDKFIGGPNMVLYKDRIFVLGRVYLDEDNKKKGTKTALAEIINKKVNVLKIFKSRGDTGYPGIILNGDILSISYYSAHIQNKDSEIKQKPIKGTAIYFSEINLSTF